MQYLKDIKRDDLIIKGNDILENKLESIIKDRNFETKLDGILVNNKIPFTFNSEDYKTKEGKPKYTNANKIGKSGTAVAVITKNTVSKYYSEGIEYPKPVNYEKIIEKNGNKEDDNVGIFQKCHTIGYHLSARFSDYNNVFIGTQHLNTISMKSIEDEIVKLAESENRKILYKVTPLYMFEKDIVPFGVLLEYESIDNKDKINGCQFCYNIQPNHKINYFDGSNMKIEDIQMPEVEAWKEHENKSKVSSIKKERKNYYLNTKTNVFHLIYNEKEKCEDLKGVAIKFIQEVTGKREEILQNDKFKLCEKCEMKYNILNNKIERKD